MITSETAKKLLNGENKVSLDLGITETFVKQIKDEFFLNETDTVKSADLKKIVNDQRSIYFVDNKKVFMAATARTHFYKLAKTTGAPTLEIDGIRMHRTKNTSPEKDSEEKLKMLDLHCGNVLDTCMGRIYSNWST